MHPAPVTMTEHEPADNRVGTGAATLGTLVSSLDSSVIELLDSPDGLGVEIRSMTLLETGDIEDSETIGAIADVYLPVGISVDVLIAWLQVFEGRQHRPKLMLVKNARPEVALRNAAKKSGIALAAVHPKASSGHIYSLIQKLLTQSTYRSRSAESSAPTGDSDLFTLSETVAELTGGLVTIDDNALHILAYSAGHEGEDDLRQRSILGREWPSAYTQWLDEQGTFEHLRRSDAVVDVPAEPKIGAAQRLAVSIRRPDQRAESTSDTQQQHLGTIWVQSTDKPLADDSDEVLRGAAAVASRILIRTLDASSRENTQVQRLFGAMGGGIDVTSLADSLSLSIEGPAALVGFSTDKQEPADLQRLTNSLRLHASAFRRDAVTTHIVDRVYVLFPHAEEDALIGEWAADTIQHLEIRSQVVARAAVAVMIPRLYGVPEARREVDRVLDVPGDKPSRVTTLAASRTAVLLGEILDLVGSHDRLRDPRVDRLLSYDDKNSSDMQFTLATYLAAFGDVKKAAALLNVHTNTLRYRVRRAEQIMGISLDESDTRLLTELQLALLARGPAEPERLSSDA
ncbi:CdaR family transcriptional regulator [Rhodococcus sp. ARC_M6]|uniref:PucR family transcriptional regulator n=1 Tax=Rhodococcus sp. ARC_M6 TaxID=2928852 RepID=UPI001FB26C73|nr:helix-turn-helix domain-containing protein [Rhodococcus sp. ARC_M6]MCJ0905866.1 helix-turn-helix domain-containing protein [Rhodococcus sp. ARC_M6]